MLRELFIITQGIIVDIESDIVVSTLGASLKKTSVGIQMIESLIDMYQENIKPQLQTQFYNLQHQFEMLKKGTYCVLFFLLFVFIFFIVFFYCFYKKINATEMEKELRPLNTRGNPNDEEKDEEN